MRGYLERQWQDDKREGEDRERESGEMEAKSRGSYIATVALSMQKERWKGSR